MSVNCVYCGQVNNDGVTVCQSCGRTLPPSPGASAGGSFGQQPSWGSAPPAGQPAAPPSYPPAGGAPGGGSYGGAPDGSYGNAGGGYPGGTQPSGSPWQAPAAPDPSAQSWQSPGGSYGSSGSSFGGGGYDPSGGSSFGQQGGFGGGGGGNWQPAPMGMGMGMGNPAAASAKQKAMIGMICSIAGLILQCLCLNYLLGGAGIVLGVLAKQGMKQAGSTDGSGMALAAIIVGALAWVVGIGFVIISIAIQSL